MMIPTLARHGMRFTFVTDESSIKEVCIYSSQNEKERVMN